MFSGQKCLQIWHPWSWSKQNRTYELSTRGVGVIRMLWGQCGIHFYPTLKSPLMDLLPRKQTGRTTESSYGVAFPTHYACSLGPEMDSAYICSVYIFNLDTTFMHRMFRPLQHTHTNPQPEPFGTHQAGRWNRELSTLPSSSGLHPAWLETRKHIYGILSIKLKKFKDWNRVFNFLSHSSEKLMILVSSPILHCWLLLLIWTLEGKSEFFSWAKIEWPFRQLTARRRRDGKFPVENCYTNSERQFWPHSLGWETKKKTGKLKKSWTRSVWECFSKLIKLLDAAAVK